LREAENRAELLLRAARSLELERATVSWNRIGRWPIVP
jgi:hypothetical protein